MRWPKLLAGCAVLPIVLVLTARSRRREGDRSPMDS
jgi:hypothetical protein